jgi:hypothetical protein
MPTPWDTDGATTIDGPDDDETASGHIVEGHGYHRRHC